MFSGHLRTAAVFHSISCRILCFNGAHIDAPPPVTTDIEQQGAEYKESLRRRLRRLFWICYLFDKDISIRIGQPPSINDGHCDLTLPPGYLEGSYDTLDHFDRNSAFIGDLRLIFLKSKASQLLYSAASLKKSDAELLRDIRELDEELEEWRLSISVQYRPALSLPQNLRIETEADRSKTMHVAVMHFEYYYIMSMIHSASGRCQAWTNDERNGKSGTTSSQALAVEASRSIVKYLRTVVELGLMNICTFW